MTQRNRKKYVKLAPAGGATADIINRVLLDGKEAAAEQLLACYEVGAELCESPIEKLLLAQLVHPRLGWEFDTEVHVMRPPSGLVEHTEPPPIDGIWLYPQVKIGNYRVDFLLRYTRAGRSKNLIVECDGHDFHERTKSQAQRDKSRDRFLVGKGYRVVRFTGSELFANSYECAYEALCLLTDLA